MSEQELTEQDVDKIKKFASKKQAAVLTILIDDIVGSCRIAEEMGDEKYRKFKEEVHDKPFMEIITRDNKGEVIKAIGKGKIIKSRGDGFLAVFSEPSTAVECALELQEKFHKHKEISIRIGLSMGQVILETVGVHTDVVGRFANWAARAEAASESGHILVTRGVYENASAWLPNSKARWKRHGFYVLKEGEQPLEFFEPYNANTTEPMEKPRSGICKDPELPHAKEFTGIINPETPFRINVWMEKKGEPSRYRNITVVPKIESFQYKLGDKVAVCFESTQDAYVYMFNIGPTGDITDLLPNKFCKDNDMKAGIIYKFPDDKASFDWELHEPVGTEIIKVFATKTPADMERMKETLFEATDTCRNIKVVSRMSPDQWAEASCSFVVSKPG